MKNIINRLGIYCLAVTAMPMHAATLFVDSESQVCATYNAQQRDCTGVNGSVFITIQQAIDNVNAGDTILVREGTYREVLNMTRSGSENLPITLSNFANEQVTIAGGNVLPPFPQGLLKIEKQQYIIVKGLRFRDSLYYGISVAHSQHIQIKDCEVAHTQHGGIIFEHSDNLLVDGCEVHHTNQLGGDAWHEAVSFENTDTFEIKNSRVYDNKEEGIDAKYNARNGLIHHNEAFRNGSANIYIDGAHHIDVYNNKIYSNTLTDRPGMSIAVEAAWNRNKDNAHHIRLYNNLIYDNTVGLSFWIEDGADQFANLNNIVIANNVFHDNNRNNWGAIFFINGTVDNYGDNNLIINNIFWDNTAPDGWSRTLLDMAGVIEKFSVQNNLFKAGEPSSTYGDNAVLTDDVGFVDMINRDYRIVDDSPARDAGIVHGHITEDFIGTPRAADNPVDIGAYEIPSRLGPPSNIRIIQP